MFPSLSSTAGLIAGHDTTFATIATRAQRHQATHPVAVAEEISRPLARGERPRNATLHVRRAKNGKPSAHPLLGDEVRAMRELRRQSPASAFVFATECGGPFMADAVNRLIKRIGARAGLPTCSAMGEATPWHAGHDTRRVQDWLGHRSIQHARRRSRTSGDNEAGGFASWA